MANLGIYLCFMFIVHTMSESLLVQKLETSNLRCNINNSKYWEIIDWYFERTPYVVTTYINEGHREKMDFSTAFLMQLTKCD